MIPTPEAITQARLDADLTQVQLAGRIGVHQTTLSWWETGRSRPRGQRLRRLAFALARPQWLAGTQPDSQPEEQPLLLHRDDLAIACPGCGQERGYVKDSRPTPTGIRRRRECFTCGHRWTTREIPDAMVPTEGAEDKVIESLIAALRTLGVEVSILGRVRDHGTAAEG